MAEDVPEPGYTSESLVSWLVERTHMSRRAVTKILEGDRHAPLELQLKISKALRTGNRQAPLSFLVALEASLADEAVQRDQRARRQLHAEREAAGEVVRGEVVRHEGVPGQGNSVRIQADVGNMHSMPERPAPPGSRAEQLISFHDDLLKTVRQGKAGALVDYKGNRRVLADWSETYARILELGECSKADIRRLRARFLELKEGQPPAVTVTAESELQATTTVEFAELLRKIIKRAGLRGSKLAERAGLSTSQMYSMSCPKRAILPTMGEQVRSLAWACGLDHDQVVRVMRLWGELHDRELVALEQEPEFTSVLSAQLWTLVEYARSESESMDGVDVTTALLQAVLRVLAGDVSAEFDNRLWAMRTFFGSLTDTQRAGLRTEVDVVYRQRRVADVVHQERGVVQGDGLGVVGGQHLPVEDQ